MRLLIAVAVSLVLFAPVRAENPADVVAAAIRAQGGDAIAKTRQMVMTASGRVTVNRDRFNADWVAKWNLPGEFRYDIMVNQTNGKSRTEIIFATVRASHSINGAPPVPLNAVQFKQMEDEAHCYTVCRLEPLKEKKFKLTSLPDAVAGGEPVSAIKVAEEGKPDVTLYFSKAKGFLVKSSYQASGVTKETEYGDYKQFDGVRLPTKMNHLENGTPMGEWTIAGYEFVSSFPPGTFK